MSNILKMNLFRLRKTKIAYIMLIMAVALSLLFFGLDWLISYEMEELVGGINQMPGWEPPENNVWDVTRNAMVYGSVPMAAVMGTLLFLFTEISTGYVKNLVGYETNKYRLAGANLLTAAIYSGIVLLADTLAMFFMTVIGYRNLSFDNAGKFLVWMLVAYVETLAFVMLMQMLSDLTGKAIPFMILGALYAFMAMTVYQLIDLIFQLGLKIEDFAVEKYTLLGGLTSYRLADGWKGIIISGVIAAAVLAGVYFLDVLALRKREIR